MQGMVNWVKHTSHGFYQSFIRSSFGQTFSQVYEITSIVYHSPVIRGYLYQSSFEFFTGASQVLNPSLWRALRRSKKTQMVLKEALKSNLLFYLLPVLTYELSKTINKALVKNLNPEYYESHSDEVSEHLAEIGFFYLMLIHAFDCALYNSCIAKTFSDENPPTGFLKACDDGFVLTMRASFVSSFYWMSSYGVTKIIQSSVPYGEYFYYPSLALLYGQCFMEYKLNTLGMCTTHRDKIHANNKALELGWGASFLSLNAMSDALFNRIFGFNNYFINDALFSVLFQHFILLATLIDQPLKLDGNGIDFFYYGREALNDSYFRIMELLNYSKSKNKIDWDNIAQQLKKAAYPAAWIHPDFQSLERFVARQSVGIFIDIYRNDLEYCIHQIKKLRNFSPAYLSKRIPNIFLPKPLLNLKNILKIFLADYLGLTINGVEALLHQRALFLEKEASQPLAIKNFSHRDISTFILEDYLETMPHPDKEAIYKKFIEEENDDFEIVTPEERQAILKEFVEGFDSDSNESESEQTEASLDDDELFEQLSALRKNSLFKDTPQTKQEIMPKPTVSPRPK